MEIHLIEKGLLMLKTAVCPFVCSVVGSSVKSIGSYLVRQAAAHRVILYGIKTTFVLSRVNHFR